MNELLASALLGLVEGLTEFLPISSTGHLILVSKLVEFTGAFAEAFEVLIQLGAILAVVIYFRKRIFPVGLVADPLVRRDSIALWSKVAVAVFPALAIGALGGKAIKEHLFTPTVVAGALIVGGIVLILVDRNERPARYPTLESITFRTALFIGMFQCLAMVPGTSRSAATIIGAMVLGASRGAAAEFSFFLAIPTLAAASAYSLLSLELAPTPHQWLQLAIGSAVAFASALAVIAVLMNYIRTNSFRPFGWYRIALGALVLLLLVR